MSDVEPNWLVKSSGRVLGPYTMEQIGELLRTREISVVDEVASPMRRWQIVQHHEKFRELVQRLRHHALAENTEAGFTPTHTDSTTNVTQTLTDLLESDLTDELTESGRSFTKTSKEIVIENVVDESGPLPVVAGGRFQTQNTQGPAVRRQADRTAKLLWMVTGLVLILVAGFVIFKRSTAPVRTANLSISAVRQNVINDVQVGRYSEALKLMKSYFTSADNAGELSIYYGILAIQIEGQTTLGRRLLNQVIASDRPEKKQAYTGLGVADLLDHDWSGALKHFESALRIDPDYFPALTNLAIVKSHLGDKTSAVETAWNIFKRYPVNPEPLLLLAQWTESASERANVKGRLTSYANSQWNHLNEVKFFELLLSDGLKGQPLVESVRGFLDLDPRMVLDHRKNFFVYRGDLDWGNWQSQCEKLASRLNDRSTGSTLMAACRAYEDRWDLAKKEIEVAANRSPKDPLVQAWYAYILGKTGDVDQASVVLGRSNEMNRAGDFKLPTLLQARFCQDQGDIECASSNWQRIYDRDVDQVTAVAGLAWVFAQNQKFEEASKFLDRGLKLSPDYIPLLSLRQVAETGGWYAPR